MIMKVSRYSNFRVSVTYLRPPPVKHRKISISESGRAKRDEVSLSPRADEVRKLTELAKSTPDVRQNKIEAIKEQIKSGTYKVSATSVAKSIADLHRKIYPDIE